MAIRDTQDELIFEVPGGGLAPGGLRDTQDSLIFEAPAGVLQPGNLRDSQDCLVYEYPFINDMFVYQVAGSTVLTGFTPVFPPVKRQPLALWGMEAVRHDSITSEGMKRSVLERIDGVTTLTFPYVAGSDMAAWKAFEAFATGGGTFAYRPNKNAYARDAWDNTGFSTFKLIDMDWKPHFEAPQAFSLEMKLRLVKDM